MRESGQEAAIPAGRGLTSPMRQKRFLNSAQIVRGADGIP